MQDITLKCYFRPRIYDGKLRVNIFYGEAYIGTIREKGIIDMEGAAFPDRYELIVEHGMFHVIKKVV